VGWPKESASSSGAGAHQQVVSDGHAHEDPQTCLRQVQHVRRVFADYDGISVSDAQQQVLNITRIFKKPASSNLLRGLSESYLQPATVSD
jgi:hypothetical protein